MQQSKEPLDWMELLNTRAKELSAERDQVIKTIRNGMVEKTIIFIDVVGSTAFKQDFKATPEVWILRIRQFSMLLADAVKSANGRVVKFIGDEIMAVFDNVYDAQNLVGRIDEIEHSLKEATGFETKLKVAVDYGQVYLLSFPGHEESDPQGPTVDRCARIGKFGVPGEVLASVDFVKKTPKLVWKKLGQTELKGLGSQLIYQLERATAEILQTISITVERHNELLEMEQDLPIQLDQAKQINESLVKQLRTAGQVVSKTEDLSDSDDEEQLWENVQQAIYELNGAISKAEGVPKSQYARFLFLRMKGFGEQANKFEYKVFDECIDAGLVESDSDGVFTLDESHPLNKKTINIMRKIDSALQDYLEKYEQRAEDYFKWSLSDPLFWKEYVGYNVSSF